MTKNQNKEEIRKRESLKLRKFFNTTEKFLEKYFIWKAPIMPDSVRTWFIDVMPWLAFGIGALFTFMLAITLGAVLLFLPQTEFTSLFSVFTVFIFLLGIIQVILILISVPGLFKKTLKGWRYILVASFMGIIISVLNFSPIGIIFSFLLFYIILQIKSYYH